MKKEASVNCYNIIVRVTALFCLVLIITISCACNKSISYTCLTNTSEKVIVTVDSSERKYTLKESGTMYYLMDGDEELLGFTFITDEKYKEYMSNIQSNEYTELCKATTTSGISYVQYKYDNGTDLKNNLIGWITGSNTGIIVGSAHEQDVFENSLTLLEFKVVK